MDAGGFDPTPSSSCLIPLGVSMTLYRRRTGRLASWPPRPTGDRARPRWSMKLAVKPLVLPSPCFVSSSLGLLGPRSDGGRSGGSRGWPPRGLGPASGPPRQGCSRFPRISLEFTQFSSLFSCRWERHVCSRRRSEGNSQNLNSTSYIIKYCH